MTTTSITSRSLSCLTKIHRGDFGRPIFNLERRTVK